jgi:ATP-dependent helicase/nuclease subunit A
VIADKGAREALDTATSFIVQAPAGSGKTELLIQRYLKLLEIVDSPDGVVAITFTRKAAGEMRSRVVESLRIAETGVAPVAEHERLTFDIALRVLAHDRQRNWNLLHNPAQMRIETIDALCAAITRRMPWLARFGAMPEISENAGDLYREAARNTLRHADDDREALSYLLLHLDNDFQRAEQLICQMLERRDQWLRHTGADPDFAAVRATLEASLEKLILDHLRVLRDRFDDDVAAEIALLRELEKFPDASIDCLPAWNKVAELLLTAAGDWRKQVGKAGFPVGHPLKSRCERLLARLQREDALLEDVRRFRELPSPRFTDSQWQAMQAAVSVLTLAVAELQLVFRHHGRVDFAELAIRASGALGQIESPSDLALALGQRIQHLLVDEFQDTSYTQFELLGKLTVGWEPGDGRTLFLVGDPMQSIYRFRQADVSLFLKAKQEGIGAIRLEPLTLSTNFRSAPDLVAWVNRTFQQVLPGEDNIESGAVAYSPSVSGLATGDAQIGVHAFVHGQDEADRVLELVKNDPGEKIAILVRARTHLAEIVSALKREKVAFQAIEIDQLGERPVIQDLMALTFALLHAADRVSWLAILRAPWCGLALHDLHALAGAHPGATIWDLLHSKQCHLSEDGVSRLQRILPVLEQALASRSRQSLRALVEGAWLRLGGPACVEDETALEDAAAYFDLLEGLEGGADLTDFEWLREQVRLLFAQPNTQAGPRLQLMTIHKAKGLEFDSVILPALESPPRKDDQRLLLWLEQRGELLLAPISESGRDADPIYRYLDRMERRKVEQETGRILYVAATRARRRLHLLGSVKKKDDGSIAEPAAGSFLKLLWPGVSESFASISQPRPSEQLPKANMLRRVPADWKVPAPPPSVPWIARTIERVELPQVTYEWVSDRLRHTGTALHGLVQRIAREGLGVWNEETVRARRRLYEAVLANLGVSPLELPEATKRVETALLRTLRDPRGRWILAAHSEAAGEVPIAGLIDGKLSESVIDRTFIDDAGVRWIVDYKTSDHEGSDLENFFETEKERHKEQLERYARLMFQRDERPIRLGLYFPLLGGWREWGASVVLRKQATLFEL